jgi:hypothetical protein
VPGSSEYGSLQKIATGAGSTAIWTASRVFATGDAVVDYGEAVIYSRHTHQARS